MKTNWRYRFILWRDRLTVKFHTPIFVTMILVYWLYHILFRGWFTYLFYPKMYVIKCGDIISDMERDRKGTPWWNKYDCAAARQAVLHNDQEEIATFTWRNHPWFLDNEILYVSSPNYKARVAARKTKVYHSG